MGKGRKQIGTAWSILRDLSFVSLHLIHKVNVCVGWLAGIGQTNLKARRATNRSPREGTRRCSHSWQLLREIGLAGGGQGRRIPPTSTLERLEFVTLFIHKRFCFTVENIAIFEERRTWAGSFSNYLNLIIFRGYSLCVSFWSFLKLLIFSRTGFEIKKKKKKKD